MALERKISKNKKVSIDTKFEERDDIKKLVFYVVVVNYGQSGNVIKLLRNNHSSAQYVQIGEGTAKKEVLDVLGIEDVRKEIIYTLIRDDYLKNFTKELQAYFLSSKKNAGLGFSIDLDSIVGVKLYKFFTQTVRG